MSNYTKLWNLIIDISNKLKSTHEDNFDGLTFWKSFKSKLQEVNKPSGTWNYETHDKLRLLFNKKINIINNDLDSKNNLIEHIHFIRQVLWIPHKDDGKLSFVRLMQIALNIGQLIGSLQKYSDRTLAQLIINNMEELKNIYNYIDQKTLDSFRLEDSKLQEIEVILNDQIINPSLMNIISTSDSSTPLMIGGEIQNRYNIKYSTNL